MYTFQGKRRSFLPKLPDFQETFWGFHGNRRGFLAFQRGQLPRTFWKLVCRASRTLREFLCQNAIPCTCIQCMCLQYTCMMHICSIQFYHQEKDCCQQPFYSTCMKITCLIIWWQYTMQIFWKANKNFIILYICMQ